MKNGCKKKDLIETFFTSPSGLIYDVLGRLTGSRNYNDLLRSFLTVGPGLKE